MKELNYTKQDWIVEGNFIYALHDGICNRFDATVNAGYADQGRTPKEEIFANTKLMGSSPEMYKLLKRIKSLIDSGDWKLPEGFSETEVNWLNSVLNKIEG